MTNGFILLSRNLLESDVFASQKLLKIWIWCLLKANHKDRTIPLKVGKGERLVKVKRGSFIFGRMKAEDELYIDGSTIYKLMKKLSELDMISIKSNNQYSIVSINKYNAYQSADNYKVTTKEQPSNNQVTAKAQPSNTNKKVNNDKNVNNDKEVNIPTYSDFKLYAFSQKDNINESSLKLKYESWCINNWKDGNNKPIKNWKVKLLNTIPYLKENLNGNNKDDYFIDKEGKKRKKLIH